jgi:hypothetical protein
MSWIPVVHLDLLLYLREFSNTFEIILFLFLGAWGKMIYEKNLKPKSRDTVPLKGLDPPASVRICTLIARPWIRIRIRSNNLLLISSVLTWKRNKTLEVFFFTRSRAWRTCLQAYKIPVYIISHFQFKKTIQRKDRILIYSTCYCS